jgi:hypothetical protein
MLGSARNKSISGDLAVTAAAAAADTALESSRTPLLPVFGFSFRARELTENDESLLKECKENPPPKDLQTPNLSLSAGNLKDVPDCKDIRKGWKFVERSSIILKILLTPA